VYSSHVRRALLALLVLLGCGPHLTKVEDVVTLASPLMGTQGWGFTAGNAFPGACVPHGLAKPGPGTIGKKYGEALFLHYDGYWYGDETIRGFSQLHLHGTGASDYGALTLAPVDQSVSAPFTLDSYASTFAKSSEHASPGSYVVHLDQWNVEVELTASAHVAWHRYTWAAGAQPRVVLDLTRVLGGTVEQMEVTAVSGTVLRGSAVLLGGMSGGFGGNHVFFELRALRPWTALDTGTPGFAVMDFDASAPVELGMGLSLVSAEGATKNFDAEAFASFDDAKKAAVSQWSDLLGRITVYGADASKTAAFYSGLHHGFLMPALISDVDGSYAFGGATHTATSPTMSDFSLWDSYRTVHPLYALVAPESAVASVNSLVRQAQARNGAFTRWPLGTGETGTMIGSPADIVIADAALRGVDGPDYEAAWQLLRPPALVMPSGTRSSGPSYMTLGFVPSAENGRSAALTLEYSNADSALANLAAKLGHEGDAAALLERSHGWRKLFDPQNKVVRAINADGTYAREPFDPTSVLDFAETDALQNTWMPSHDPEGFVQLFGSKEAAATELDNFFQATLPEIDKLAKLPIEERFPNEHYFAGNEPDIEAPFDFSLFGRADLAAKWSVWARTQFYSEKPEGEPGNDDGGALALWYVEAMLGLYPVPGSDVWLLGSPAFPRVEITVPGGIFTIEADGVTDTAIYVQSATIDGQTLDSPVLHQAQLKAGSTLMLKMGETPKAF
jgi:predicted alpha-1,2-mannosidase